MIFFSFGIPKSASSFVFQITLQALESLDKSVHGELRGIKEVIPEFPDSVFVEDILRDWAGATDFARDDRATVQLRLDQFFEHTNRQLMGKKDVVILLKTHLPCSPNVELAIRNGLAMASATFRHPAEMILSRLDMAKREREELTIEKLLSGYRKFIDDFYSWAAIPQVRKYYYENIAVNPDTIARSVYAHVGATKSFSEMLDEFLNSKKEKILQFNVGATNRHLREMSPAEIGNVEEYFSDYIQYIHRHKELTALRKLVEAN